MHAAFCSDLGEVVCPVGPILQKVWLLLHAWQCLVQYLDRKNITGPMMMMMMMMIVMVMMMKVMVMMMIVMVITMMMMI